MAEKYTCYCMEIKPTYTLNLTEKIGFNINSMYVRMHVCVFIQVFIIYFVCLFFVYLHVSTYVTLVALHRLCGLMSINYY